MIRVETVAYCDAPTCQERFFERGHHAWAYMAQRLPDGWSTVKVRRPDVQSWSPVDFLCPDHSYLDAGRAV